VVCCFGIPFAVCESDHEKNFKVELGFIPGCAAFEKRRDFTELPVGNGG